MIYLDSAATSRPSKAVIEAVNWSMETCFANPSSIHRLGFLSEKALREAREHVAAALGVDASRLIFTSGGTEANQIALCGASTKHRGGLILMPETEHSSVFEAPIPRDRVRLIPVDSCGRLDYDWIRRTLREERVALITVMHVNNEIGTVHSPARIRALLKEAGSEAFFHVDGVQSFGKMDLRDVIPHVDSFALSGHKIHALKGVGCLFRKDWSGFQPLQTGGQQEMRRRAGTENLSGILSLGVAARESAKRDEAVAGRMKAAFVNRLRELELEHRVNGAPEASSDYILSLTFDGIKGEVLVHMLEMNEIYISTRSACSSKKREMSRVLRALGFDMPAADGTLRISFGIDPAAESGRMMTSDERVEMVRNAAQSLAESVREIQRFTHSRGKKR